MNYTDLALKIYDSIVYVCDVLFNYCPIHYQLLYFYFPILYFFLNVKKQNTTEKNSMWTYIFINLKNIFYKLLNINLLLIFLKNIIKKFYITTLFYFNVKLGFFIKTIVLIFKKNHFFLNWKPIFKKHLILVYSLTLDQNDTNNN